MIGAEVAEEGGRLWAIESFFKEGKHQFGLAQFATRTATGLDRWVLLVFTAPTLTMLHHTQNLTLEEAAFLALTLALPFVRLNRFLRRRGQEENFLRQHGYAGASPESQAISFTQHVLKPLRVDVTPAPLDRHDAF